ncbi:hypothetical protein [Chengkuizengella marina]|uniref:hypothetical protein n=1 Tax=Chengkuizengella marina TaxID=2507566 RepID=UPI00136D41ED|nr:hypothetical protein [Chengkuizengella marina]
MRGLNNKVESLDIIDILLDEIKSKSRSEAILKAQLKQLTIENERLKKQKSNDKNKK